MPGPIRLALFGAVTSAAQIPLQRPLQQQPLPSADSLAPLDSERLQHRIRIENLRHRAEALYDIARRSEDDWGHPTRVIGSPGHLGTLDYIRSTLAGLGGYYAVSDQVFSAVVGNVTEARLVIGHTVPNSTAFSLTPPTENKEPVYGDLILVPGSGCDSDAYPDVVAGNIALVRRGECSFGAKSELAGRAGATALVIVNNEDGELHGTLGTPSPHQVATFGLSKADGDKFVGQLEKGHKLDAIAYMDANVDTIQTTNVIAQTLHGNADNCVMLGGHSDGVAEGPGINDDGSGSLSVLEIAVQLSHYRVNNCVRFAWWAAEEEGLVGSDFYVASLDDDENKKIRLFMDYDMLASPNFGYQVYNATNAENPAGSQQLRDLYVDWFDKHGFNHTLVPFDGRSDYDGFIRHGIPAGGITSGADGVKTKEEEDMFGGKAGQWFDECYHQACDDLDNLDYTAWEVNTKLIAHAVAVFADSFKDFPERTVPRRAVAVSQTPARRRRTPVM
ncbi:peptidase family M28 domain-containing protein [Hirsutella rhossiliensis]|uniref:Peptide hydrolase n=1 Tax=Hirsutella rhossiliensis TaxID=111463 RepID=A0A9P8N391_9HYPO|nr:peptidase family m28 domain-containing protein [Hirsutella rhossiliensis]KAH0966075.1 peptidase family m28 domain-containing protein [Hirsutella rhossiliensis]